MKMLTYKTALIVSVAVTLTAAAALAQSPRPAFGDTQGVERVERAQFRGGDHRHGGRQGERRVRARLERLLETFDSNADGGVTQEEITETRQAQLAEFDANQDGSLDLTEYEALWLSVMRDRMVDRFQAHDDDGDGAVTAAEFEEEFARLVNRWDRNGDGVLNADDRRDGGRGAEAPEADE
ncbi:EF-hand domain-containing protein [Actibacterium sp. 188UL27-1]|uniref:EF-hand domain-containing protein n=1 Tax=Actibacterium sp. 188UL27-1 TaxID=2786961 RepID=UPI0019581508|nr:hypothetical protein [Actibacterium sp. 188UL27-1]MBM7068066.1 hypothetical protein [Actibacterium sp. 188UL27-1]